MATARSSAKLLGGAGALAVRTQGGAGSVNRRPAGVGAVAAWPEGAGTWGLRRAWPRPEGKALDPETPACPAVVRGPQVSHAGRERRLGTPAEGYSISEPRIFSVLQLPDGLVLPFPMDASSGPWNPASASSISSPSLLLPIPAIVFIAVGVYLLLLGLVLLARHCLLAQGCCTDCSFPCRKQTASETQDCCWSCAEACDFPLPSPAHYLDACCPHPSEGWAPRCPRCCPLCDCACACQIPDCQSLNCLCFEIKLR